MRPQRHDEPIWMVAHSRQILDTSRYLGELSDLPTGEVQPGDWCDVVIADSEGEMRWTLVLVECTSATSIFAGRRGGTSPSRTRDARLRAKACRPTRREGEVAPLSPDLGARGPVAGTDGKGSAAGSARVSDGPGLASAG
jgi:hypothetical protein